MRVGPRFVLLGLLLAPLVAVAEERIEWLSSFPRRARPPVVQPGEIYSLAFVGSSRSVVFGTVGELRSASRGDDAVKIGDFLGNAFAFACSPDGKLVAVAVGTTSTITVYAMKTGNPRYSLPGAEGGTYVAWSPSGEHVLSTSKWGGQVCISSIVSRGLVFERKGESKQTVWAGYVADDPYLIVAPDNVSFEIRDARTGTVTRKFLRSHSAFDRAALSADGEWIAFGDARGIEVCDRATGRRISSQRLLEPPTAVALSARGERLCVATESKRLFFVEPGDEEATWEDSPRTRHAGSIRGIALTADGRRALTIGSDRWVQLWDVERAEHVRRIPCDSARDVIRSPDGKTAFVTTDTGSISVDLEAGKITGAGDAAPKGLRALPGAVAILDSRRVLASSFTPDGKRALIATPDLELWDVEKNQRVWRYENTPQAFGAVGVTADGTRGVAMHHDRQLRVWWLAKPWAYTLRNVKDMGVPSAMAFGPRDEWVLIGTTDGRLHRFSLPRGE